MLLALVVTGEMSDELSDGVESMSNESTSKGDTGNEENQATVSEDNIGGTDAFAQRSFYDDLDLFEIRDDDIKDIGIVSKNKLIQGALEGFISIKRARN